jgi:hypothetical protein
MKIIKIMFQPLKKVTLAIVAALYLFQINLYAGSIRTSSNGGLDSGTYTQTGTFDHPYTYTFSGEDIGFPINFFGTTTSVVYVYPQGFVSFGSGSISHMFENVDYSVPTNNNLSLIGAYKGVWAPTGSNPTKFGRAKIEGKNVYLVHWDNISSDSGGWAT